MIKIGSMELEHPIMNSAGGCKSMSEFELMLGTPVSAIVVGSITKEPRTGNQGEVFVDRGTYALNALGLPNPGAEYYKQHLPEMVRLAHGNGKRLILSIAGETAAEYAYLAALGDDAGVDLVEVNLSCPNRWSGHGQKEIHCFSQFQVLKILERIDEENPLVELSVKCSPFSNPNDLRAFAGVLREWEQVVAVTAINSFANGLALDASGKPLLSVPHGFGGVTGPVLKPIALGQVSALKNSLPEKALIGVGGIETGGDVHNYLRVGASAVQVGTAYLTKKGDAWKRVFEQLLIEYCE